MSKFLLVAMLVAPLAVIGADEAKGKKNGEKGFISLFDGKSLNGWKVNKENPKSITVKDGNIVIDGPRTHLFYAGDVEKHNFKNFVLRAQVKTFPKANSGIYFHTKYEDSGWPYAGFEAQVNNTHGDPKKSGGLYAVKDVNPAPAKDGEWFDYEIRVKDKKVIIKINGKITSSWKEVPNAPHLKSMPGRKLGSGTFALQAHDPKSVVHYRNIRVRPLK
ncbi:MAG: DUF1080 domain-containing protein [Verrucomicrobiota bacterium]|jgi:hypothetical protein|nr:DUF1080 domain-containing protein [Verrucomicrobiota bacterium]MDP7177350.1 DUF1080 domain-containing protein [Verrucomicrobiota bacterium]MDP7291236.1 DUF1080 domain-containing protein [Verrucomicrobiota bacterium]MDP7441250.1 DUF1080 domain-containing protein [Verrucomicrobiota bacterium]HJN82292.1 DUF1080 domain-containing protein [Verrucomicrobiota bacterium]|tara:strand:+ start:96 stop:749 length:654 start_codon:yes stop_codon:yes gene_type:complete